MPSGALAPAPAPSLLIDPVEYGGAIVNQPNPLVLPSPTPPAPPIPDITTWPTQAQYVLTTQCTVGDSLSYVPDQSLAAPPAYDLPQRSPPFSSTPERTTSLPDHYSPLA